MESKIFCQEETRVSLIEAPYSKVKELPLKTLATFRDTLIIDAAELVRSAGRNVFYPINAFHLKYFVENELAKELHENNYRSVVVLGVKVLFFDPNVLDSECCDMMRSVLETIKSVASGKAEVLMIDFDEEYGNIRNYELREAMQASAEVAFDAQKVIAQP